LAAAFVTRTNGSQELETEDAGFMVVGKGEMESIIPNEIGSQSFQIGWYTLGIERSASGHFILASCAGTVLPQVTQREDAHVTVLPGDLELILSYFLKFDWLCRYHRCLSELSGSAVKSYSSTI
jgi:hypothetical protein